MRSHGGLGIWADFLEEVGFRMGLSRWVGQTKQTKEKAFLEVRGTQKLGEVGGLEEPQKFAKAFDILLGLAHENRTCLFSQNKSCLQIIFMRSGFQDSEENCQNKNTGHEIWGPKNIAM